MAQGARRHAVVDTLGFGWGLCVTPADVPDSRGARAAVRKARAVIVGRRTHLWADSAYRGLLAYCWVPLDMTVGVVTRRAVGVGY